MKQEKTLEKKEKVLSPDYFTEGKITCSCGNVMSVGSTVQDMNIEICSNCHPYYTGQAKVMDTAGRVERFKSRFEKSRQLSDQKKSKKPAKKA
jgi:large subunit ribosomal protein L31